MLSLLAKCCALNLNLVLNLVPVPVPTRYCHALGSCVWCRIACHRGILNLVDTCTSVLKVKIKKMTPPGFANSSRARCAIYSRDTAIRIYSVSQLRRKNSFVKISLWAKVMGFAKYFCRPLFVWIFQIWPYPRQNPM
jgi:hypothetical protein